MTRNGILLILLASTMMLAGCAGPKHTKNAHTRRRPSAEKNGRKAERSDVTDTATNQQKKSRDSRYDITLAQIRAHQAAQSAIMIDARDPAQFSQGHLSGAINLPAGAQQEHISRILEQVQSDQLLIIYCASAFCEASNIIYDYLQTQGYTNLRIYKPGWAVLSIGDVERTGG